MYYYNVGDITVHDNDTANKIREKWSREYSEYQLLPEPVLLNGEYVIDVDGIEYYMDDFLREIIQICAKANTYLEFDIRYSGDETGGYHYKTGETYDNIMQYLDGIDISLLDADDKHLIDACKHRSIWPDIEAAYRKQEHEYLRQDAERHLEEYFDGHVRKYIQIGSPSDWNDLIEKLVSMFEDMRDCNVSENDTWDSVIAKYVQEAGE